MKTPAKSGFATRPGPADRWIAGNKPGGAASPENFSARLTIDVTPAMRRRLKLAAVRQGTTVADLMRALINEHFPEAGKDFA